ncbi:hypothetical protein KY285_025775 [Solanum tuberosum]|nr:hypothetical protein KY289_024017 [Solanum tuberosum]KAH0677974.1 hypothetical protein KY285_025775 [Solanum tuberosum]
MGSSSKNFKQSLLPPSALAMGRGQSHKSMGTVKVTAEKRNLIDQTDITLETMRGKSEKKIGHNFTSGGSVKESNVRGSVEKRTMVGNNKGFNSATYTQNVVAQKINVVPPSFDPLEDETSFPNDDLEVMQETVTSKPTKENGHNITSVCSVKGSNVVQRTSIGKSDTFFPRDDLEVMGRGNRFTSPSSVRGDIGKRIMIGNNKGLNSATYTQNVVAQKINVVPPGFDALEDETSFPNDDLEVMQETVTSKLAKENGHNITYVCSVKGSNVVQRTSIGKKVDTFFPPNDLEVMGRGNRFTSLSSTNVVCPDFDAIEVETSFPHDDHEVMQENMRSKPSKENGKNITSVGSARGSTFVQRTSIGKSNGYSVVSSDMNDMTLPFLMMILKQCKEALRSKSAKERAQSFTYVGPTRRCAEKRTSNGKNKDSRNTEYDLNELTQDDLTLPQDEVEVMQDTRRSKTDIEEAKLEHMWGAVTSPVVTYQ